MARGLDELIEALVGEVSYYGDGCPVTRILDVIKECQYGGDIEPAQNAGPGDAAATTGAPQDEGGADEPKPAVQAGLLSEADLGFARKVWGWFLSRTEAQVGPRGEWNHLSLDDVLALPEEAPEEQTPGPPGARAPKAVTQKAMPSARPRIFVSEETIWKCLTGHEPNHKRVPPLEWKCLVGIASAKEKGIVQGDLVRLTGQDKRSVPKRTDFLAQKGYIAKRTTMVRKSKTSKLWLSRFAPSLLQNADEPVHNQLHGVELSRAVLVDNLEPVPWCSRWSGDVIDFLAFGQTFLAIVKAWGVIRITDLKTKLGILGSTWQMKTLAKQCRRFAAIGIIAYVAAVFQNDRKVFKDCIKYIRDPTDEEWRDFLSTGKKSSQYSDQTQNKQPKTVLGFHGGAASQSAADDGSGADRRPAKRKLPLSFTKWRPEKPVANTAFEALQLAGPAGLSNPELSNATVGFAFRRYMHTYLSALTIPDSQPPNVQQFQLSSSLVRTGKTTSYMYSVAPGAFPGRQHDGKPGDVGVLKDQASQDAQPYGFLKPSTRMYGIIETATLSELGKPAATPSGRTQSGKASSRPNNAAGERNSPADVAPATKPRRGKPKKAVPVSAEPPAPVADEPKEPPPPPPPPPPRPPGVYIGKPGSLNPHVKPKGRPRKSLVVIFRSDKLKDTGLFQKPAAAAPLRDSAGGPSGAAPVRRSSRRKCQEDERVEEADSIVVGGAEPLPDIPENPGTVQDGDSIVVAGASTGDQDDSHLQAPDGSDREAPAAPSITAPLNRATIKVLYNGARGELSFSRERRLLCFSADAEADRDETLEISLGDITDGPAVRATPGSKKKGLVLSAKTAGEDGLTRPYIFLLDEAVLVSGEAESLREQIAHSKDRPESPEATALDEPDAAQATPVQEKGRKGKAGGRPYVCQTCGNTWKNDVGLKYHLTKSKTACNPDYVPAPRLYQPPNPVKRRRYHASPGGSVFRGSAAKADAEPSSPRRRLRHASATPGPKGLGRRQIRPVTTEMGAPRGLRAYQPETPPSLPADSEAPAAVQAPSPPAAAPTPASIDSAPERAAYRETEASPAATVGHDAVASGAHVEEPKAAVEKTAANVPVPSGHTQDEEAPAQAMDISTSAQAPIPMEIDETPHNADTARAENEEPQDKTNELVQKSASAGATTPVRPSATQHEPRGDAKDGSKVEGTRARARVPLPRSSGDTARGFSRTDNAPALAEDSGAYVPKFSPPRRKPGSRMSESGLRTLQAQEMIKFMLDNSGGAFPGGKALWYAAMKVWNRDINDSQPLSLSSTYAALRKLQSKGEAKEVVYGFKDSTGRYVTCSLVLRGQLDPNGPIATAMKRRVQELHPNLYIPPPFSLSRGDLLKFQNLDDSAGDAKQPDGKSPAKKHGRRDDKLLENVEVLRAPFYAKSGLNGVRPRKHPLEDNDEISEDRRNNANMAEELLEGRAAKRPRVGESPRLKDFVSYTDDEGYDDDGDEGDGDGWPPGRRRRRRREEDSDVLGRLGSTIVPPPKRFRMTGSSGAAGDNPGISSLPPSFFSRAGAAKGSARPFPSPVRVQFLEPNTRLDEFDDEEGEDNHQSPDSSMEPAKTESSRIEKSSVQGPFSGTVVLNDVRNFQGSWPALDDKFFQDNSGSFAMSGWMPSPHALSKELLPRTVEDMASRLSNRFKPESWADPAWGSFCQNVQQCRKWEVSEHGAQIMTSVRAAPDYVFINFSPDQSVSSMAQMSDLQWLEENSWMLETIPYHSLEDEDSGDHYLIYGISRRGGYRGRGRHRGHGGGHQPTGTQGPSKSALQQRRKAMQAVFERPRELSAYPRKPEDYIPAPADGGDDVDWTANDTRIAAFVCTSTLLGGLSKIQDWGLLMRLFPDMKISRLRKYWREIRKEREAYIQELTETFQDAFLEAYEKGELPPIDYDNTLAYDWRRLVKWTLQLRAQRSVELPARREDLEAEYDIEEADAEPRDWREDYYHWQRSIFKRFQDATSEPAAAAVDASAPKRSSKELATLARSWVRAVCVTAENRYPANLIRDKLSKLGGLDAQRINGLLREAINELDSRKILRRALRSSTGRPYSLNERFDTSLARYSQEDKFTQAAAFKARLDAAFRGHEAVTVPYLTDDGMIMAVMNLQAGGRVRTEPVEEPRIPFGFRPGFYETRHLPKKHYHWALRVVPTGRYVYSEDVEVLRAAPAAPIPGECPDGRLPVWCDIFGAVDGERWARVLSSVVFMLATRGAMTAEATFAALRTVTEVFEVEMVTRWARELGVLVEVVPGGALTVGEWWWLVCGQQLAANKKGGPAEAGGGGGVDVDVEPDEADEADEAADDDDEESD